jgi:hypothetical protein
MQRSTARSAILDLRPFSPFLIGRPFDFIHAFSSGAACLSVQAELTRTDANEAAACPCRGRYPQGLQRSRQGGVNEAAHQANRVR